jgi:hypothetical protein
MNQIPTFTNESLFLVPNHLHTMTKNALNTLLDLHSLDEDEMKFLSHFLRNIH